MMLTILIVSSSLILWSCRRAGRGERARGRGRNGNAVSADGIAQQREAALVRTRAACTRTIATGDDAARLDRRELRAHARGRTLVGSPQSASRRAARGGVLDWRTAGMRQDAFP